MNKMPPFANCAENKRSPNPELHVIDLRNVSDRISGLTDLLGQNAAVFLRPEHTKPAIVTCGVPAQPDQGCSHFSQCRDLTRTIENKLDVLAEMIGRIDC